MSKAWQILQSSWVIQNHWVSLRQDMCQLPDGRVIDDYYVLEDHDVGSVFGMTGDQKVILVEQYKHAIQEVCLELPAGFFEDHGGDPLQEARREFREETGYDAEQFHRIGVFAQSPTRLRSRIHQFIALDAYPAAIQFLDPNEDITVRLVPMDEVLAMIADGRIHAVATVAGIYRAWHWMQQRERS